MKNRNQMLAIALSAAGLVLQQQSAFGNAACYSGAPSMTCFSGDVGNNCWWCWDFNIANQEFVHSYTPCGESDGNPAGRGTSCGNI